MDGPICNSDRPLPDEQVLESVPPRWLASADEARGQPEHRGSHHANRGRATKSNNSSCAVQLLVLFDPWQAGQLRLFICNNAWGRSSVVDACSPPFLT